TARLDANAHLVLAGILKRPPHFSELSWFPNLNGFVGLTHFRCSLFVPGLADEDLGPSRTAGYLAKLRDILPYLEAPWIVSKLCRAEPCFEASFARSTGSRACRIVLSTWGWSRRPRGSLSLPQPASVRPSPDCGSSCGSSLGGERYRHRRTKSPVGGFPAR